jgi:hypothetical protein
MCTDIIDCHVSVSVCRKYLSMEIVIFIIVYQKLSINENVYIYKICCASNYIP